MTLGLLVMASVLVFINAVCVIWAPFLSAQSALASCLIFIGCFTKLKPSWWRAVIMRLTHTVFVASILFWSYLWAGNWPHYTGDIGAALCVISLLLLVFRAPYATLGVSVVLIACVLFLTVSISEKHCFLCDYSRRHWQIAATAAAVVSMVLSNPRWERIGSWIGIALTALLAAWSIWDPPVSMVAVVSLGVTACVQRVIRPRDVWPIDATGTAGI